jgi:hypothetical protein
MHAFVWVSLIAASFSMSPTSKADDFLKNGQYMTAAIRNGDIERVKRLLTSPYVDERGYKMSSGWESYLFDSLDSIHDGEGYDMLEIISKLKYKLPDRTNDDIQCNDAEKIFIRIMVRTRISLIKSLNILMENTNIDFEAPLSCLAKYGSLTAYAILFGRNNSTADIAYLFDLEKNPAAESEAGNYSTHFAAVRRRPDIMEFLINKGVPFTLKNKFGLLPIDLTNRGGSVGACGQPQPLSPADVQIRDMLILKGSPAPTTVVIPNSCRW